MVHMAEWDLTVRRQQTAAHPGASTIPVDGYALVVEDDPAIRRLLEALLASAGYAVRAVIDGDDALDLCEVDPPAALFLDVTLPGLSGWDVLAALRARGSLVPVVLLTADAGARRRARQAGAAGVITKPFDIDQVLDVAARLLDPGEE